MIHFKKINPKVIDILSLPLIAIAILICFWKSDILVLPVLGLLAVFSITQNKENFRIINGTEIILISLLLIEILIFLTSEFKPNSNSFIRQLIVTCGVTFFLQKLIIDRAYKLFILSLIVIWIFILSTLNICVFIFKFYELQNYGFTDFTQFRYMYYPIGLFSNEWVTIIFASISFPIILLYEIENSEEKKNFAINIKTIRILIILFYIIIIFNLFVSFSRGAYLTFLFLFILVNVFILLLRVLSIRHLLIFNSSIIGVVVILFLMFQSETLTTINSSSESHQRSFSGRVSQWESTINIFKDYPITGIGQNNYTLVNSSYKYFRADASFTGRVNNSYIQLLIERGIIGFFVYFLIILFLLLIILNKKLYRNHKGGIISLAIVASILSVIIRELFFSSVFYNAGLFLLLLMNISLLMAYHPNRIGIIIKKKHFAQFIFVLFIIAGIINEIIYLKEQKSISKLTNQINNSDYSTALNFIESQKTFYINNSHIRSLCGLIYERNLEEPLLKNINYYNRSNRDKQLIEKAITCYLKAIQKNPFEEMNYNNISWLYFSSNNLDSALVNINKAIHYSNDQSLYYLTKANFLEKNNLQEALACYKMAIQISPDYVNSEHFIEMTKRLSISKEKIIKEAIIELNKQKNNYVIQAKIGKLYLDLEILDSAKTILSVVIEKMPSLNRPWLYLGQIYEQNNDKDTTILQYYLKAHFLDINDPLPASSLASYYHQVEDSIISEYYSQFASQSYLHIKSENASRAIRKYGIQFPSDNIIPEGFLHKIRPVFE